MQKKVRNFMEEYHMVEREDIILAAVSGGADSLCLLLLLHALCGGMGYTLRVVHVEHGIRGEASLQDARFVEEICGRYQIPCRIYHCQALEYAREKKLSVEEAARKLRYQLFREAAEEFGANKIAVAHNQNDCAETMLFHLTRGSGLKGLCGILPVRGQIIRPLLCLARQEIEACLQQLGQDFCMDETNGQLMYTRNKIRHQVLPLLTQVNDNAVFHMNQAANDVAEAVELIEGMRLLAAEKYVCESAEGVCISQKLLEEPSLIVREALRNVLADTAGSSKDISRIHVQQMYDLFARQNGKVVELPYKMRAQRTYEGIMLRKDSAQKLTNASAPGAGSRAAVESISDSVRSVSLTLPIGGSLDVPSYGYEISTRLLEKSPQNEEIPKKIYTKWFDYDRIKGTTRLKTRQEQDYLIINAQGNRKKIKKYFIDEKIPACQRDHILLLADDTHVLWVIGYRISEDVKVTEHTKRILEIRVDGGRECE